MSPRRLAPTPEAGVPLEALPNGAFGHSATGTDLLCLFKGWTYLCTSADGAMPRESLAGYTAYGTRMVTGYRFRIDGRDPQPTLCTQIGSSEWAGLFVLPP